ncbi:glycosyltransferase [Sodalis sp. RH16]|uniref:glycosyltransferase n=1 Tax=Sodalis sp. RH16 TaxID=3394331 RepID=UPI0039B4AA4B
MKVFHAAETIKGGVATVLNNLAVYQKDNNKIDKITILIPKEHLSELSPALNDSITTFNRKKRNTFSLFNFSISFFKIVKSFQPDIVHLHSTYAGFLGRLILYFFFHKNKIKIIYCPHAFAFLMDTSKFKRKFYNICEINLSKITERIICVGENEYHDAILWGIPKNKLILINNGVDIPKNKNVKTHNKLDEYLLLYVGRFDYQKGIDIFIDALKIIDREKLNYKIKVILIGETVNEDMDYKSVKFENIDIKYTGWINRELVIDYYRQADCLIIPSRWEGFAMVPLEAISYYLPIITSDIPAFNTINKISGLSFKKGDSKSLANILARLNEYDLDSAKEKLMGKLLITYTKDIMNEQTLDLYVR